MKILVFTTFFNRVVFTTLLQIKMAKLRKKSLVFGSGHHNCSSFVCMWPYKDTTYILILDPFRSFRFEDDFTRFIYLFQLTKKRFLCLFSKYGNFTALVMKINLNRFFYCSLLFYQKRNFYWWLFEKSDFSRFWLNYFYQKIFFSVASNQFETNLTFLGQFPSPIQL